MNIYQENGYENRQEYLEALALDYGVSLEAVLAIAAVYGPSEDFDGLVTTIQDLDVEI